MTEPSKRRVGRSWGISTQEAAWLTGLPAKTINATIDRGELLRFKSRKRRGSDRTARVLSPTDVVYLALRKDISAVLSADAKSELYEQLAKREWAAISGRAGGRREPEGEIRLGGGLIRVELRSTYRRLFKRWLALRNARSLVVSDPEIRGGEPIIRGTRVPVYLIADLMKQGASVKELLEDYPALTTQTLRSALAYTETHPRRGRPRKAPWK